MKKLSRRIVQPFSWYVGVVGISLVVFAGTWSLQDVKKQGFYSKSYQDVSMVDLKYSECGFSEIESSVREFWRYRMSIDTDHDGIRDNFVYYDPGEGLRAAFFLSLGIKLPTSEWVAIGRPKRYSFQVVSLDGGKTLFLFNLA
jgi:hypothetical protein